MEVFGVSGGSPAVSSVFRVAAFNYALEFTNKKLDRYLKNCV